MKYSRGVLIGIGRVIEISAKTPEDLEEATRLMMSHRDEPQPGVGPAFQAPEPEMPSMRDLFAGQALAGIINLHTEALKMGIAGRPVSAIAQIAYEYADAMLVERAKAKP